MTTINWTIPTLPPDVRADTHNRSNRIAAGHLVARAVGLLALFYGTVQAIQLQMPAVGLILLIALSFFWSFLGWAGLGHELFHNSVFTIKKLNRFLFVACSVLTWNNFGFFDYSHRVHHKVTMFEGDPEGRGMIGIPVRSFFWLLVIDAPTALRKIRILIRNAFGRFPGRLEETIQSLPETRDGIVQGARITLAAQLLVIVSLSYFWTPLASAVWVVAPFTFTFVNRILENAQHAGMQENVNDFRLNTRTVRLNTALGLIYSNMHLHVEHHMYPKAPYYNLPKLHEFLQASGEWMPEPTDGLRGAMKAVIAASELD